MNRTLALRASASVRAAAGKVPRATILAYNGGRIHPPGFPDGVVIDLANLQSVPRPALLLDHQDDQVVGQADQVTIGARTVELGGPITGNIEDPNDPAGKVIFHARRGFIWPCSVGVAINSIERLLPGQTASANGQTFTGPVEVVRAGLLQEVSFLSVAADADARATIAAKRAARGVSMDFREWLENAGFDPGSPDLNDKARDTLLRQYEAERLTASGVPGDLNESWTTERDQIVAEHMRARPREESLVRATAEVARDEGWSPGRLKLELLRGRGYGFVNNDPSKNNSPAGGLTQEVIEAGFVRTMGHGHRIEKMFGANVAQREQDQHFRGPTDILERGLRARGINTSRMNGPRVIWQEALRATAGPSTINMPESLASAGQRIAQAEFLEAPASWRSWCTIETVKDFRQTTLITPVFKVSFDDIGIGGEVHHGSASEETTTVQASTSGRLLEISRVDMINDDLGLFSRLSAALARAAARKISDEVYKALLGGIGTFWAAGHGNYSSGAGSALSVDAIAEVVRLLRIQSDDNGAALDLVPGVLMVGPSNEHRARQILNSSQLQRDATVDQSPTGNPVSTMGLTLEVESRLENDTFPGYSANHWWLLCKGGRAGTPATMVVVFLNGQETPTIENVQTPADRLGYCTRGYLDFGASLSQYRLGVMSAGA